MFAYFIGGPMDLTKKAIKPTESGLTPSQHFAPVPPRMTEFAKHPSPEQVIEVHRHEYRRMWRDGDYVIYVYEGIR